MSDITRYTGGITARAEAKAYGRALTRLQANTGFGLARVDATAELQAAKLDAQTLISRRGVENAALLGSVARAAMEAAPESAAAIAYVAQQGVMALGSLVLDSAYELRRIR